MNLNFTEQLMQDKLKKNDFDSYAVLVGINGDEKLITSKNVNEDTYFDVASMGKVLVTSTLVLHTVDVGKLALDDKLTKFFKNIPKDKENITVRQLLTHTSGIVRVPIPDRIADCGKDVVAEYILGSKLAFEPGTDYEYSCNACILSGYILEKIYGMPLDEIYEKLLVKPLGLTRSRFNIKKDEENAAICCRWKYFGKSMADDENVYTLGGIAGSGGSFSSADDINKFVKAVLNKDERLYKKELFDEAEKNYSPNSRQMQGLGYNIVDENFNQTGKLFPVGSFGHTGHCGQSFFINRELNLYAIILTNATRFANMKNDFKGYDYNDIMKMREEIHNAIYRDLKECKLL